MSRPRIPEYARKAPARTRVPGRWSGPPAARSRSNVLHRSGHPSTCRRASTPGPRVRSSTRSTGPWWSGPRNAPQAHSGTSRPTCPGRRPSRYADSRCGRPRPRGRRGPDPRGNAEAPGSAPYTRSPGASLSGRLGGGADRRREARHGLTAAPGWRVPPPARTRSPECPGRPVTSVPCPPRRRRAGPAGATPGRTGPAHAR